MSTHANLRHTIKALCAPAVVAMLTWQAPVAQAAVTADNGEYFYNDPRFSSSSATTTFSFDVTNNFGSETDLVSGSPRPLQLTNADVSSNDGGVIPMVTGRFHNCIQVTVSSNPQGQSGSSGIFSITYTVADAAGQQDSGTLTFSPGDGNSFNDPAKPRCEDRDFDSSVAAPDAASTQANTPVTINVLKNDTVGGEALPRIAPLLLRAGPVGATDTTVAPTIAVTEGGTTLPVPAIQVDGTSKNGGTVRTNADGTVTYTPASGFSGTDTFNYTIQDYNQKGFEDLNSSTAVTVTVAAAPAANQAIIAFNGQPLANASNLAVPDSDGVTGESVTFDGSQTVLATQGQKSFQWFVNDIAQPDGKAATFTTKLADGPSTVALVVSATGPDGESTISVSSLVNVTVAAPGNGQATILVNNAPVANGTFALTDSDGKPGEKPTFDGSRSILAGGGAPTSFQWFVGSTDTPQGTGPTFSPQLPDGPAVVRLVVSNGQKSASSAVNVTVGGVATLANIPGLSKNQLQVARALDNICSQLEQNFQNAPATLTADQNDLRTRCEGILASGAADQRRALDELGATDFNGARLQTLLFTNSLYAGVQDRLMALRGGAKGISLAGLNILIDGKPVPLAQLQEMFGKMLGGGAAADEPGSLLSDKWGAWSRGNFTFGDKDPSRNDKGFDADQFSLTAGLDYRVSDKAVIGGAIAYGSSNLDYNPRGEGGLDTTSWAVSIYGSRYEGKNFYIDALVNAANSSYESDRRIGYNEVINGVRGTVQRQAKGDTDGFTLSGGLSGGYDFVLRGLTVSPNLGVFYVDSTIDKFREKRSGGLNLLYDEQSFQSLTGTFGFRANYAWNLSWGVLLPYVRADYVREFNKNVEAFNVHFVNDPKNPANTIAVQSDQPDESYVRLVGGLSGQFPFGISGYVEYQRLQGFEFVNFNDLSMGLRVQYRY